MTAEVLPAASAPPVGPFDYAGLDAETRIVVQQKMSEIKTLARRAASDVIEIGAKLAEVKERLGHGRFGQWLAAEFGWSQDTAGRFLAVAAKFGQIPQIAEFAPSALYLLAAASVPDEARNQAIDRAAAGEHITVATAKAIIDDVLPMSEPDALKPAVLAWARSVSPSDPRGVLQQIVITNSPVGVSHFERLGEYLREQGYRFMRASAKTAVQRLIEDLARPEPRVVYIPHEPSGTDGAAVPAGERATCKICHRPLSDPASVARGAGDVCSGHHDAARNGNGRSNGHTPSSSASSAASASAEPEPQEEPAEVDLPGVVLAWLDERVENLEMATDTEARILCLERCIAARNGYAQSSAQAAWKSLRSAKDWPATADNDAKVRAIRIAIARLKGIAEEPAEETQEVDVEPVARPASPPVGGAHYNTLLDRKTDHVERFIKAAQALRAWARQHPAALDEDAELKAAFDLLEDARVQAMCLD